MVRLSQEQVSERLKTLTGWILDGETVVKKFKFPDFQKAIGFVNKVAEVAEDLNHHPTIVINYNRITLALTTHSAGGLTEKDFQMAARIDAIK